MGKGDIRSRRGKVWRGTFGVSRPSKRKRKAARPAPPSRKVKALKDIPKAVAEQVVKKPVAETIPVIETVQPEIPGVTAEVPQIVEEPAVEAPIAEAEGEAKAKKAAKPAAKAPAAKKPAAKKAPAAKKKK